MKVLANCRKLNYPHSKLQIFFSLVSHQSVMSNIVEDHIELNSKSTFILCHFDGMKGTLEHLQWLLLIQRIIIFNFLYLSRDNRE